MLDINLIRESPDIVKKDLEKRNQLDKLPWITEIRELDAEWKNLKLQVDDLRHLRNKLSLEVGKLKKEGKDAAAALKQASDIPTIIAEKEARQTDIWKRIEGRLMALPNILHESVPFGSDDTHNKVEKEFGKKPKPSKAKSHVDLLEQLKLADLERAAKISGARFWFLKGDLVLLEMALQRYAVDFMVKKGYTPVQPPFMMGRKPYEGVVSLGDFQDVMYKIEGEDLYLIATSEHPLTGIAIALGQLGNRGGLSGAVHAQEQRHVGRDGRGRARRAADAEQGGHPVCQQGAHGLGIGRALAPERGAGGFQDGSGGRRAEIRGEEGLLQLLQDSLVQGGATEEPLQLLAQPVPCLAQAVAQAGKKAKWCRRGFGRHQRD